MEEYDCKACGGVLEKVGPGRFVCTYCNNIHLNYKDQVIVEALQDYKVKLGSEIQVLQSQLEDEKAGKTELERRASRIKNPYGPYLLAMTIVFFVLFGRFIFFTYDVDVAFEWGVALAALIGLYACNILHLQGCKNKSNRLSRECDRALDKINDLKEVIREKTNQYHEIGAENETQ
jgi:hypothetical protein